MADAGLARGFSVTMTTFALQDYPLISAVIQSQLSRSTSTSTSSPRRRARSPPTTAAGPSTGISPAAACAATSTATWPSSTRPRPPTRPGTRSTRTQGVEADRQRPDPARPEQAAADLQGGAAGAADEPGADPARRDLEVPGRSATRVKNMYVAFSDFNTGLRNVWLSVDGQQSGPTRRGAAAAASLRRSDA